VYFDTNDGAHHAPSEVFGSAKAGALALQMPCPAAVTSAVFPLRLMSCPWFGLLYSQVGNWVIFSYKVLPDVVSTIS
jgi:hypothetical protein